MYFNIGAHRLLLRLYCEFLCLNKCYFIPENRFLKKFNKCTKSQKDIISKSQLIFKFQGDISLFWNPYVIHKSLQGKEKDVMLLREVISTITFQTNIYNTW